MSLSQTRTDIALALRTVSGVTGYPSRRATPKPGDAWPLLGELERGEGWAFYVTWRVMVYLPQDEVAASNWIDSHFEALVDALQPIAHVDRVEPVAVPDGTTSYLYLQITMRGE